MSVNSLAWSSAVLVEPKRGEAVPFPTSHRHAKCQGPAEEGGRKGNLAGTQVCVPPHEKTRTPACPVLVGRVRKMSLPLLKLGGRSLQKIRVAQKRGQPLTGTER